jgi:isopentenyldiphosphate isomerase
MITAMIRAPIRNKDNERVCDVILYEKTSKVSIVTKEGRQTRYIDYEELKEKIESLKTTTE